MSVKKTRTLKRKGNGNGNNESGSKLSLLPLTCIYTLFRKLSNRREFGDAKKGSGSTRAGAVSERTCDELFLRKRLTIRKKGDRISERISSENREEKRQNQKTGKRCKRCKKRRRHIYVARGERGLVLSPKRCKKRQRKRGKDPAFSIERKSRLSRMHKIYLRKEKSAHKISEENEREEL